MDKVTGNKLVMVIKKNRCVEQRFFLSSESLHALHEVAGHGGLHHLASALELLQKAVNLCD